jgi:ribonuclease D
MLDKIAGCRALAIDTEFMRDKTYHPLLCLVQCATDDEEFIIDPLSVKNLKALAPILTDERTVKVFHAGKQDRELIFSYCGVAASPVFDTQSAAPLLGMPQQVGYGTAVETFCGVKLKKLDSLTDWTLRPLSNRQIDYSLDDVRYLLPMYDKMRERLEERGRMHWLDAEFAAMSDPATFEKPESELWHKVKKANSLPRRKLVHVQSIAIWRERIAARRDIPRRWVLPDELVVEISRVEPTSTSELYRIRGTREKLTSSMAKDLVHLIERGKEAAPETWPVKSKKKHANNGSDALADMLMGLVRVRAKEHDLAPQVLAVHDDLAALASGEREGLDLLEGWRYEIVGRELVGLLEGREMLKVENGTIVAVPVE